MSHTLDNKVSSLFPIFSIIPHVCDKFTGHTALIIGSSCYALQEAIDCINTIQSPHIIGLNDSPIITGIRPDHWVSLHYDRLHRWQHVYEKLYGVITDDCIFHSTSNYSQTIDIVWKIFRVGGGSAGLAVIAALYMGYSKIILCGCPLDDTPRATNLLIGCEHGHLKYSECLSFFEAHREGLKRLGVRSMSGQTARLLGKP